jgi:hypothetical protein
MLIDALEGDRINTKGRIAYLGGAHAEGPLLAPSGHSQTSIRCYYRALLKLSLGELFVKIFLAIHTSAQIEASNANSVILSNQ